MIGFYEGHLVAIIFIKRETGDIQFLIMVQKKLEKELNSELEGVAGVGDTVQAAKQSMLECIDIQLELGNLRHQEF